MLPGDLSAERAEPLWVDQHATAGNDEARVCSSVGTGHTLFEQRSCARRIDDSLPGRLDSMGYQQEHLKALGLRDPT